jgi:hypothetical protein
MQEQELFQQYELKGWQVSPRFYKIIGASALINMLAFFLMAQSNFLTGKTCDSPLASGVCSVLDALYIGSVMATTDSGYVDKEYVQTEIGDEEVTFVNVGDYVPLNYPDGYFALANPETQMPEVVNDPNAMFPPSTTPGFPNDSTLQNSVNDPMNMKPTVPAQTKNPYNGTLPNSPIGNYPSTKVSRPKKDRKNPLTDNPPIDATPKDDTVANKTTETPNKNESEPVKEIEINRKPFEDLGDIINAGLAKNEVDLNKPFAVILDGAITADGKLDPNKSKFVKSDGDPQMVAVAKSALEAVGNSGFLGYLKTNGIDRVNITLVQNDKEIFAMVISDQKTAEKAASTASGLNTMLQGARLLDKNGLKTLDPNSRVLVENSQISSEKNNFILKFTLPKEAGQAIINQTLKERAEKKKLSSSGEIDKNTSARTGK